MDTFGDNGHNPKESSMNTTSKRQVWTQPHIIMDTFRDNGHNQKESSMNTNYKREVWTQPQIWTQLKREKYEHNL